MDIAFAVANNYTSQFFIRDFIYRIKSEYGPFATFSTVGLSDGDMIVKKYGIQAGFSYKEYNLAYTEQNLYSAMDPDYYGKKYHPTHYHHAYMLLVRGCEKLTIFKSTFDSDKWLDMVQRLAKKFNKPYVIFN